MYSSVTFYKAAHQAMVKLWAAIAWRFHARSLALSATGHGYMPLMALRARWRDRCRRPCARQTPHELMPNRPRGDFLACLLSNTDCAGLLAFLYRAMVMARCFAPPIYRDSRCRSLRFPQHAPDSALAQASSSIGSTRPMACKIFRLGFGMRAKMHLPG